jgi:hypothetical protein
MRIGFLRIRDNTNNGAAALTLVHGVDNFSAAFHRVCEDADGGM